MDWQEAYQNLSFDPLAANDPRLLRELFEPYLDTVVRKLIQFKGSSMKLLFSSHVGGGKSTFFNVLADEPDIKRSYFVAKLMIKDFADPQDIDHVDILLGIALRVTEAAQAEGLGFDRSAIKSLRDIAKALGGLLVTEKVITKSRLAGLSAEAGVGVPAIIKWLHANFSAQFQLQHEVREGVREFYRPRITEFLDNLDVVLNSVRVSLGARDPSRELLVLVDDTDKPRPASRARELFSDYAERLARPKAAIVYAVGPDVSCWRDYKNIAGRFGNEEFMPCVRIDTAEGKRCMLDLLRCRVAQDIMPDPELEEIVRLGGGHTRETIRMCREAVFAASGKVDSAHVQTAARRARNEFNLNAEDARLLREFRAKPRLTPGPEPEQETFFSLLMMNALLQYRNGEDKWYAPIPVLNPWLDELR